jgi:hypothetical protein
LAVLKRTRPINTYNRQGVSKHGVAKWQHAIAFSSRSEPAVAAEERPRAGEGGGMMPGIRIVPRSKWDKMDPKSRIDFGRVYTVEHNVKVYDFGDVHYSYLKRLIDQWLSVIRPDSGISHNRGQESHGSKAMDGEEYVDEGEDEDEQVEEEEE